MKRFGLLLLLTVALGACAPAAVPTFDRTDETVVVTVEANTAIYGATLSIVNATTSDPRCTALGGESGVADLGCALGDLAPGSVTTITVASPLPADLSCVVFGSLEPGNATTYRPFPCKARAGGA